MGDKEPDFSNDEEAFNFVDMPSCSFADIFQDNDLCMHTHTCDPPVADLPHTHTCLHVHTKVLSDGNVGIGSDDAEKKSNRGNREATRKYREKIKAETAFLKMEVKRLKAVNWQLLKGQAENKSLGAENVRLKCLLADIKGRIEGEIGSFPYQKPVDPNTIVPAAYVVNPCNMRGNDQACCLRQGGEGETPMTGCEFQPMQCSANQYSGFKEPPANT